MFPIKCKDWIDPEKLGIGLYTFYYILHKEDGTTEKSTMATTGKSETPAVLPLGNFSIYAVMRDILMAETEYAIGNVKTIMPSEEDHNAFNASNKLLYYADTGDTNMAAMLSKAMSSVNQNAPWTSLDPDDLQNSNKSVDELLLELSKSVGSQIDTIKNGAKPTNINQAKMGGDVLFGAVGSVLTNEIASYTLDIEVRESTTVVLEGLTDSLEDMNVGSAKQFDDFFVSALNTMVALTKTMNTILKNHTRAPPRDKELAADMDYDAGISSTNVDIPRSKEEMHVKNVIDLTEKQYMDHMIRFKKMTNKFCDLIEDKLILGEVHSTYAEATGATLIVAKISETETKEKSLKIEDHFTSIKFPKKFCPSKIQRGASACRETFRACTVIWPVTTHGYSRTVGYVSESSQIIDLDISISGALVKIKDLKKNIMFDIPRSPDPLPNATYAKGPDNQDKRTSLIYHYFNISIPQAAYIIKVTPEEEVADVFLLISYNRFPLFNSYDHFYMLKDLPEKMGTYTLFVKADGNGLTGPAVAAIGKLAADSSAKRGNFSKTDFLKEFDFEYSLEVIISGCYYFDTEEKRWTGDKQVFSVEATDSHTICASNHLTAFGFGFIPTPNEIDFEFVVANMSFRSNMVLYTVVAIFTLLYIIMMIWGHYKDKKDIERRGAIPLPDNNLEDKYIYEICFHTGPDADAPCESNIFFIVSGDIEETDVRHLPAPNLNLYRRNDRNTFVMTTTNPLGNIRYLRVFHDNSGRPPYDSWQIARVVIRDLQTSEFYYFETNSWLALDRSEGVIDKTFLCNNEISTLTFSQKMYYNTQKGINQDQMWLSVFLRPMGSRFTRKERVTVCAVFLYLSMLVSAMYYKAEDIPIHEIGYFIGIVKISLSVVITGFLVLGVVFPISLLLITIFKRARPKNLKRCRSLDAIENQKKQQLLQSGIDEESAAEGSKIVEVPGVQRTKEIPLVRCLPWWTRVLAWLISIILIIGSILVILAYGINWGQVTATKWLASFFVTFFASLLVTQWVKVLVYSLLSSMFFKIDFAVEDMDCDEELPHLKQDETWSQFEEMPPTVARKVNLVKGIEKQKKDIRRLRIRLTKDREMKFVVRGILMYCLFLVILLVIVNDRTDVNAFLLQSHLKETFLKEGDLEFDLLRKVR